MSRLTRDGTVETVSRDQILRHDHADRGIFIFPVQLTTSRIGNLTRSIFTVLSIYVMVTIHKADIQCIGSWVSPVLSTCPLHTNSGCGKERRILIGPW